MGDKLQLFLFIFSVGLVSTIVFTPLAVKLAKVAGAIDHPSDRKVHLKDIPRFGGVAIFIGFLVATLPTFYFRQLGLLSFDVNLLVAILFGSLVVLVLGIVDDVFSVKPHVKLIWQIVAASVVIAFGISVDFISNPFNGLVYLYAFSFPLTLFWIVGIMNSINLLDGLDGLAAGVVGIAAATLLVVSVLRGQPQIASIMLAALAGVSIGFIFYNFNPASIFLGDSGSLLLGFLLAIASVAGALKSTLFVVFVIPVLMLAVPIIDTLFAIVRRIFLKKHIFQADKRHIHHRLLGLGFSHKGAVISIYICCLLLSLIALLLVVGS